jgi:Flp pilus assembly protein TadG
MGKIPKDQTGAALVEFALMLPLFLALLFGVG